MTNFSLHVDTISTNIYFEFDQDSMVEIMYRNDSSITITKYKKIEEGGFGEIVSRYCTNKRITLSDIYNIILNMA